MAIFSDFLQALGVPHTERYSDEAFEEMTFRSLFGLSKLLDSYHIPNEALRLSDKVTGVAQLQAPYLAHLSDSFVIVEDTTPEGVALRDCMGGSTVVSRDDFMAKWDGTVLLAYPEEDSSEPDYGMHRLAEIAARVRKWILWAAAIFIFGYLYVYNELWSNGWYTALIVVTLIGVYITTQLELKSLGVHTATADSICGVIDRGGCNSILATPAAKFLGLFSWSEVGLSYFSVTLVALLAFPEAFGWLALINACCCPYSLWSVWYQKFKAKKWCTLCLITQACLWLSLGCYIFGGAFASAFPLSWATALLVAVYAVVFFSLNMLNPYLSRK